MISIAKAPLLFTALALPAAGAVALTTAASMDASEIREATTMRDPVFFSRDPQRRVEVLASFAAPEDASAIEVLAVARRTAPRPPSAPAVRAKAGPRAAVQRESPAMAMPSTFGVTMGDTFDAPNVPSSNLASAMASAVGAPAIARRDDTERPAAAAQLRPAPGAVFASLRRVLPAARACLSPGDAGTTARVVFRSDGSVARVDVPDTCVRDALFSARIEPFADDTFTTSVMVRRSE
jgi:hypothetical protein